MDFLTNFYSNVTFGIGTVLVIFFIAGLHILYCLNLLNNWQHFSAYLFAPAFGFSVFGIFSFLSVSLFGYHTVVLGVTWFIFHLILWFWKKRYSSLTSSLNILTPSISFFKLLIVWLAIAFWACFPALNISPYVINDALFINAPIFDHAKIAIIDSISRHGLPAINPYYAPEGKQILLMYYYLWHFIAAELSTITGITGWQADIALTWMTGFSAMSFIAGLAIHLTQRARAGLYVVILAFTVGVFELMQIILSSGYLWEKWLAYPDGHNFELPYIQISWAPQHFFAALCVVMVLFLITKLLQITDRHQQIINAVIIGLISAAGIGSSIWVGAIAFLFALPIIIASILFLRLPKIVYWNTIQMLLISAVICIIMVSPILLTLLSQVNENPSVSVIGSSMYPSTRIMDKSTSLGKVFHGLLYWLQFLPLTLGVIYLWGGFTVFLYRTANQFERIWQYISIGGIVSFLLVAQFIKSTVANNDLGWRSISVAILLLMVWAAVGLTYLSSTQSLQNWRYGWIKHYQDTLIAPSVYGLLLIGILSFIKIWQFPNPYYYGSISSEKLSLHQSFMKQHEVWQHVQKLTERNERVQMNPDGYAELTPWAAVLPYMLFANRDVAYANPEYASNFAYRYNKQVNRQQYEQIRQVFQGNVTSNALLYLRDTLKIALLVVDSHDPLWNSNFLETSNSYKLIYGDNFCKLYRAIK